MAGGRPRSPSLLPSDGGEPGIGELVKTEVHRMSGAWLQMMSRGGAGGLVGRGLSEIVSKCSKQVLDSRSSGGRRETRAPREAKTAFNCLQHGAEIRGIVGKTTVDRG